MKIGYHARESLEGIIVRKKWEETKCGKFFWGYGGTLLHPLKQVVPFVSKSLQDGIKPLFVMSFTPSKHLAASDPWIAKEYSVDDKTWQPLPRGIVITGSKYALVCENLREANFLINPDEYRVAIGRRTGKALGKYLRFHTDKACASLAMDPAEGNLRLHVSLVGELREPYAVLLR